MSDYSGMKVVNHEQLQKVCTDILVRLGVSEEDASVTAETLVLANLRGTDSHGVMRLPFPYAVRLREGGTKPNPNIEVVMDDKACVLIEGDQSLGQAVAYKGMKTAMAKAREFGVGIACVRNGDHFGAAGFYANMAAQEDMVGFASSNGPCNMAAWGGAEAVVANSPFAFAIPAGEAPNIIFDIALSQVAAGKIMNAAAKGEKIPVGWMFDSEGKPCQDPTMLHKGCTLTPVGGHKGYGMSVVVDCVAGIMSGAEYGPLVPQNYLDMVVAPGLGMFFGAIDISRFMDIDAFKTIVDGYAGMIKATRKAEGVEALYLPGEIEWITEQKRRAEGAPLPEKVYGDIKALAEELGVEFSM
ncbi:Ldh family oxidoreductase [Candidatus Hydrogenedentota bacterium]